MPPPKTTSIAVGLNRRLNSSNKIQTGMKTNSATIKTNNSVTMPTNHNTDVSMEMNDSFTCSMASQALAMAIEKLETEQPVPAKSKDEKDDNLMAKKVDYPASSCALNDSLTFSMIANILDSEPPEADDLEVKVKGKKNVKSDAKSRKSRNAIHSPEFSPETLGVVNQLCGVTPGRKAKPAPRKANKRGSGCQEKNETSSPKQRKRTPQGKKTKGQEDMDLSNSRSDSDYVPPTPPDPNRTMSTKTPNKSTLSTKTPTRSSINTRTPTRSSIHTRTPTRSSVNTRTPTRSSVNTRTSTRSSLKNKQQTPSTPKDHVISGKEGRTHGSVNPTNEKCGNEEDAQDTSLSDPVIPMTYESFSITDAAANKTLFEHFIEEWRRQEMYALSLACEKVPARPSDAGRIGANFNKGL